jgi:hypothetical protein
MRELRRDYLGTISRAAREIGDLARIAAGPPGWRVIVYSVTSPELAAEILSQPARFRTNGPGYREMQIAMLQIPIVIAAVLQAFILKTPLSSVPLHAAITVLPSAALPLQVRPL